MESCIRNVCVLSRKIITFTAFQQLSFSTQILKPNSMIKQTARNIDKYTVRAIQCSPFHSSVINMDLMEFLDDKNNWGADEVRSGRSWRKDELRIKSNSDLHKLWYVLLKEKNMLLTMEHEYKRACERFPNPERLDRVEESMSNLEEVIRERNRAYYELETGYDGEQPHQLVENVLGLPHFHKLSEYPLPHGMNTEWQEDFLFNHWDPPHVVTFKRLMREKRLRKEKAKLKNLEKHVRGLLARFPHLTDDAILQHYPEVDVAKIRREAE